MKRILPISKKVNKDLNERISSVFAGCPASEAEAKRVLNAYLEGVEPVSENAGVMIAFAMVRVEVDRAMERSRKARCRAKKAKEAKEAKVADRAKEPDEVQESEKDDKLRRLTATRERLYGNMDEVRRLLYHEARREYDVLSAKMLEKAKADKVKHRHERLYFNPPEFGSFINGYIDRRLREISSGL